MTESQDVLVPALRGNTSVGPPYSNAQISETVTHREILRIYRMARPETRVMYDLGRDVDRVEEENWVIRWMLWHVFRYRDSRNKNRRPTSPSPERSRCYPVASIPSVAATTASRCKFLALAVYVWRLNLADFPSRRNKQHEFSSAKLLLGSGPGHMVQQMTDAVRWTKPDAWAEAPGRRRGRS